jgi:hypothetical protein
MKPEPRSPNVKQVMETMMHNRSSARPELELTP